MMVRYTKEYIERLLVRFMDGETSIAEEDVLSEYFRITKDVPEEWRDYQTMFAEWNLPLAPSKERGETEVQKAPTRWRRWLGGSAAAAAVLLVLYVAMPSQHTQQTEQTQLPAIAQAVEEPQDSTSVGPRTGKAPQRIETPPPVGGGREEAPGRGEAPRRKRPPRPNDVARDYTLLAEQEQRRVEQELADVQAEMERVQLEVLDAQLRAQGYVCIKHEDGTIEYKKENEITNYYAYEPD